ncbi:fungal hydrophobin-domain-containing protein [Infundibulicybe gibba]|nr:fungal hydrophobin-domain-containing protein [Infundibulicybe gibba]
MFSRISTLFIFALPLLAAAGAVPRTEPASQCNTGPVQCCNSVQQASSPSAASLLGPLGVVLGSNVPVGLTCSPISAVGIAGNSCSAQPVCCTGNNFNGLVVVGCTPVNLNL